MIRIGYHCADAVDIYSVHTIIDIRRGGYLVFDQDAHIGRGALICVKGGCLTLGKKFAISGTTSIVCTHNMVIGDEVQFSWNTLVMDSDAHVIWDKNNIEYSNCSSIVIGNKVWIAANCTLLKGTIIPNNCVIASNSLLNKKYLNPNRIIGGMPARELKEIGGWRL
ncbi:acyltransferase [Barnesiella viscericola]|uniref:acyltransferase n=1 Tax=Barnesiella viscericola TaxID=397865 RepID=UPI0024B74E1E|nr:acyltransferase [Barnesiella viscericola]